MGYGLKAKVGDHFKVKATPVLRKYGIQVGGAWRSAHDSKVWPGEIGVVIEASWTWTCSMCAGCRGGPSPDCPQCRGKGSGESSVLRLDFARGRSISVETADPADFIKVRAPKGCPV
mgnify:CR=1 FL=1